MKRALKEIVISLLISAVMAAAAPQLGEGI